MHILGISKDFKKSLKQNIKKNFFIISHLKQSNLNMSQKLNNVY